MSPRSQTQQPDDESHFARCWNEARFFDAHETLEPRWIKTRDRGLRGLIQLAAAFHHLQRGNLVGARTTLERATVRLAHPANAPCSIDQKALARYGREVLAKLEKVNPEEIVTARPRL